MFWQKRAKKFCNNPLHEAVLDDDRSSLEKHLSRKEWLSETNGLGFTPVQLAYYLQRSSLIPLLSPVSFSLPPVEKEGKTFQYSSEEFEKHLGVRYLHHLSFQNFSSLAWVVKKCRKALKEEVITTEQKWLGSYYQKELLSHTLPEITVRWINADIGWGVFSKKDLKTRDFIGEYTGYFRRKKKRRDQKNSYCFEYLIGETEETPYTIDAQDQGNFTRFINHEEGGNADPMLIFSEGMMKVILYANKPISKGSQITYDYGPDYWAKRESPAQIGK